MIEVSENIFAKLFAECVWFRKRDCKVLTVSLGLRFKYQQRRKHKGDSFAYVLVLVDSVT